MAVNNFKPTIWANEVKSVLTRKSVIAQNVAPEAGGTPGIINRNYEGEIAFFGDSVQINSIGDISVGPYDREKGFGTPQRIKTSAQTLRIDQVNGFQIFHDNIDKAQETPKLMAAAVRQATENLALLQDDYVLGEMIKGTGSDQTVEVTGAGEMYAGPILKAFKALTKSNTPGLGRFLLVDADAYAELLLDDRFVKSGADAADDRFLKGFVGQVAGFNVVLSNSPLLEGKIVAGHELATTVADQLLNLRANPLTTHSGDVADGIHVFGSLVIRPEHLAVVRWSEAGVEDPAPTTEEPATTDPAPEPGA